MPRKALIINAISYVRGLKGRFLFKKTMLTKAEKKEAVALGEDIIGKSKNVLFADFTSVPTAEVRKLRILMR